MFGRKKPLNGCEIKMNTVNFTLERELFSTFQQSIVALPAAAGEGMLAHGLELLNRPALSAEFSGPEQFYAFAAAHGRSSEVDLYTMELGLKRLYKSVQEKRLPLADARVFVNIHLSTLFTREWEIVVGRLPFNASSIVLELSEREGLDTYTKDSVVTAIRALQQAGFKIAIDDLGMGYSGLYTLAVVHPDYVKVDRQLVSKIDEDPYRQHMMNSLVEYWTREGVAVIAEGIERDEEALFFSQIGATYGQGYRFHRPAAV